MLFTLGLLLLLTPFASLQTSTNQKRNSAGNALTKTNVAFTVPKQKNSSPAKLTGRPTLNPNINQTVLPTPLPNQKPPVINATVNTRGKPRPTVNSTTVTPSVKTSTASGTVTKKDKLTVSVNQTSLAKSTRGNEVKVIKDNPGRTETFNDQSGSTRSASVNGTKTTQDKLQLNVNQTAFEKSHSDSNGKIAKVKPGPTVVQNAQSISTKSASGTKTTRNKFSASVNQTVVKSPSTGEMKNTKERPAPTVQSPLSTSAKASTTSGSAAVKEKTMVHDNQTVSVKDLKKVPTVTAAKVAATSAPASVKPRITSTADPAVVVKSPSTSDVKNSKLTDQTSADQATVNKAPSDTKVKTAPSQPIKVVIANDCESSNTKEHEMSLKPGTPVVMTHKISLIPTGCTGSCESEMAELKGRLARLEREMSSMKNKCPCSANCPNDCSDNGECQKGKCICKEGFMGPDCSTCARGADCNKREAKGTIKVKLDTEVQKENKERTTMKENIEDRTKMVAQVQLEKKDQKKGTNAKETDTKSKLATTAKLGLANAQINVDASEKRITIKGSTKATVPTVGQILLKHDGRKQEESQKGKTMTSGTKKTEFKIIKEGTVVKSYSKSDQLKDEPHSNITQSGVTNLNGTAKLGKILTRIVATNKTLAGKETKEQFTVTGKNSTQSSGSKQIKNVKLHSVDENTEKQTGTTKVSTVEDIIMDPTKTKQGRYSVTDGKTGHTSTSVVSGDDRKSDASKKTLHSVDGKTGQGRHITTEHSADASKTGRGRDTIKLHPVVAKTDQGRPATTTQVVDNRNIDASKTGKLKIIKTLHSIDGKTEQGRATTTAVRKTEQGRHTVHYVDDRKTDASKTENERDTGAERSGQGSRAHSTDNKNTDAIKTGQGRSTNTVVSVDAKTGKGKDTSTVHTSIDTTDASKIGKGSVTVKSQYIVDASIVATSENKARVSQSQTTTHGGSMTSATKTGGLGSVKVVNISSHSFIISWSAPQGMFKNFTVIRREPQAEGDEEDFQEFEEEAFGGENVQAAKNKMEVQVHKESTSSSSKVIASRSKTETKRIMLAVPGNVRSVEFSNLRTNTRYFLYVYGTAVDRKSKIHKIIATTGPEPATDMVFSNITETSLMVSWSKPKTTITGYTITYTHIVTGETHSVNLDSRQTHVVLSKLSAGSSYIITVTTTQGRVQSDALVSIITTVPAPPTHLRAINVTDTRAVLQWTPSLGKVDRFIISYESSKTPNVTVTVMVSGNSVEHQLRGLQRGTVYTIKVLSQKDSLQSAAITTSFTTANVVKASEVGARSALIVWRSSTVVYHSYRLIYQVVGEEAMELILEPTITEYKLTGLLPMSRYNILVEGERDGHYTSIVTTEFITGKLRFPYPTECSQELLNGALQSGEVDIYPQGKDGQVLRVYCDMETDGGGWTVFQRRMSGKTDFYRTWSEYRTGFGNLSEEFWLGNEILHNLTSIGPVSLRVDLRSGNETAYSHYANFSIDSEENYFALTASGYTGTAGDSMKYHNDRPFSTRDKDPDSLGIHCSRAYMGGWWYKNCYKTNLNGLYGINTNNQGVVWIDWKGKDSSIPFTEMKFRPSRFSPATHG
ncbi:serine-rich adhesin for platelets-like isoform X2 [Syngnathus acus]|uniref:serine-rich adhesin for platelets-like isoform X1 n=1 Tax=Syngnathus acus TaxID=161584 RepID=UPI001886025D|nr:serine-rich adhesin for platelets-like isoform X1 [Syngnathus acus]XP_037130075.1 serine-rich adhesin for platelets-like isoform X2 [Syngnathus acus]